MSQGDGHFSASGTKIEGAGYTKQNVLVFRSAWPCVYPSFYGSAPPVSTRITVSRVLTSFVPPAHNQGVSLAPLQGPALWKISLPTTGSFFVLSLTDLFCMIPNPAPCGGRFPGSFLISFSFPVTAEFNTQQSLLRVQFNRNRVLPAWVVCFYAACTCGRRMSPSSFPAS